MFPTNQYSHCKFILSNNKAIDFFNYFLVSIVPLENISSERGFLIPLLQMNILLEHPSPNTYLFFSKPLPTEKQAFNHSYSLVYLFSPCIPRFRRQVHNLLTNFYISIPIVEFKILPSI